MDNTEGKFHWCLEKGRIGGRKHSGLRKIKPDKEEANNHIQKALHYLEAVDYNIKGAVLATGRFQHLSMQCTIPCWLYCISLAMIQEIRNARLTQLSIL